MENYLRDALESGLKEMESGAQKSGLGGVDSRAMWENLLSSGSAQAKFWMNICAFLMVVLFVGMTVLLYVNRDAGEVVLGGIVTVTGVSLVGAIRQIVKISQSLHQIDVFDRLIRELPAEEQASIARAYLRSGDSGT